MAVGDIIVDIIQLTTGATATFQPAAGVEVILTNLAHSQTTAADDARFNLDDGTLTASIYSNPAILPNIPIIVKCGITNGHFLQLTSTDVSTREWGFTGVQTS